MAEDPQPPPDLARYVVRASSPAQFLGHYVERDALLPHVAICGRRVPHDVSRPAETPICHLCWRKAHPQ